MNWAPAATRRATASTTGSGAYPVNIDMSATLKSEYSWPSTSRNRAPLPSATNNGGWSYEVRSHDIGTPFGIDAFDRAHSSAERGRAATNAASSRRLSDAIRPGSRFPAAVMVGASSQRPGNGRPRTAIGQW